MKDYTKFVNIEVGTDSEYRESNGNTLPNVQWPFGNQAYILQSNKNAAGWFYKPHAHYCEGIRISNQPSPWLGDYGHISLLPFCGKYNIDLHTSLTQKDLSPYKMSGRLNRYETNFKLVPNKYGAKLTVNNSSGKKSKLLIDCFEGLTEYSVDEDVIYLTIRNIPEGEFSENYRKFYALKFDSPIIDVKAYVNNELTINQKSEMMQIEITIENTEYEVNVASSYIDYNYVKHHVEKLFNDSSINLEQQVKAEWNTYLNTIEMENPTTVFYSNMYRIFCYPRVISESISDEPDVYYNFKTQNVDTGKMITDVGFWDTYRTTMPLYKILIPNMYKQIISAILNYYQSYDWLPRWLAPYERGIMPSTLVDSVVAQALLDDDVDDEMVDIAIESLLKNGEVVSENKLFGREYLELYKQQGFVPDNVAGESVSISLDNYYCDYAIFKVLKKFNKPEVSRYKTRCMNYKILFNNETKYFERKNESQEFDKSFIPSEWGTDFCESSALQNNFNIFHDVQGVIDLFGGVDEVERRLDLITTELPKYNVGRYGFEIHEMTEYAKIIELGHFAISNQPSFNIPFWYLHINKQGKFKDLIAKTLTYFTDLADGYPGDEDNGSMAAWYILVNIGMYPFSPVDGLVSFDSQFEYKINEI